MSIELDLEALGAITASETRDGSDQASDTLVTEALNNTDPENIESILVDFGQLEAETQRAEGLSIAAERLRTDGKIDVLTAQGLSTISKTILGKEGRVVAYTSVPTKTGLSYAIESLLSEEEAARSQAKHAYTDLITRAGRCAQGQLETLKAESRSAKLALTKAMVDFNEEFYSVNLRDVILNDGEISMEDVLNKQIILSEAFYGEQSMFHGCQPLLSRLLLAKDIAIVPQWIGSERHYVVVDNSIVDIAQAVNERKFQNKTAFYPEDQERPRLGVIVEVAGSVAQTKYEAALVAGVTEAVYLLQGYLNQDTAAIDPDVTISEVIYLTKAASSMIRAFTASILVTQIVTQVYTGVTQGVAGIQAAA